MATLLTTNPQLLRELDALKVELILPVDQCYLTTLQVTSPVVDRIGEHHNHDSKLMKFAKQVKEGKGQDFSLKNRVL